MVRNARRGWSWSTAALLAATAIAAAAGPAAAADDNVASPQFNAWAKFKPGSSSTYAGDITANGMSIHMVMTQTLTAVTKDSVTISVSNTMTMMGHDRVMPPTTKTIAATAPAKDVKQTGTADVAAMGKTFTCKVYEVAGTAAGSAGTPAAGRPGAAAAPADTKAVIDVSDDVPGGMVKMEVKPPAAAGGGAAGGGGTLTFTLTAMTVK